jgi:hypothetical protein
LVAETGFNMSDELEHSPWSPSTAHRRAECLGSYHAELGLLDSTSKWAAEGTLFHQLQALLIDNPYWRASRFRGIFEEIGGHRVECDDDMVEHLQAGAYFIADFPGRVFVEKRVLLDPWLSGEWGTTDVGIVSRDCITIVDWKYGALPVDVYKNFQLMLYALGFWHWLNENYPEYRHIKKFRLIIKQPRIESGGGEPWGVSLSELLDFGDWIKKRHALSLQPGQPRTPGVKTCQWCKAKLGCREYLDFAADVAGLKMEAALVPYAPRVLSPEERSYVLHNWPLVEKWHELLHAQALDDAIAGRPVPGFKVIKGRSGARKWSEQERAARSLVHILGRDKVFREVMVSPTEAEKLITKEEYGVIKKYVEQSPGKPVLVALSEPGEPIVSIDDKLETLENLGNMKNG